LQVSIRLLAAKGASGARGARKRTERPPRERAGETSDLNA
jgi:hypothetical protein